MRRGAAGEAALLVALENVIKGRVKVGRAPSKPPRDADQGWELMYAPTEAETASLQSLASAVHKNGKVKSSVRLVAGGFHGDGTWTMEVRVGDKILCRYVVAIVCVCVCVCVCV